MKKWMAIGFLVLLSLQVVPVWHLLLGGVSPVSSWIDEDKPDEGKTKAPKGDKECLAVRFEFAAPRTAATRIGTIDILSLPAPFLESFSPPPDRS